MYRTLLAFAFGSSLCAPLEPPPVDLPPVEQVQVDPDPCSGPVADVLDFPVGPPDAKGYYDAQPFGRNHHLGSDWNGVGGGNTDYGDPVYAIGNGQVTEVHDHGGGWGLVVRIAHPQKRGCLESLYAHLSESSVEVGQTVERGDQIGAIGDAGGQYYAHLHFEIRVKVGLPLGGGYGHARGHIDPTETIRESREALADR